jgi:HMG (high mobility group) box
VLAEYPHFVKQLDKHKGDDDVVKDLHQLMYGIPGKKLETKKNIRQFSGFPAGVNKDEKISKMTENKKKWTVSILKTSMELFGLEKSGTREELIARLIDYLMKPKEIKGEASAKSKPKSRRSSTGSTAGKKRRKGKKSKKGDEKKPKRAPSAFLLYSNSVRAEVKEANPELSFTDIAKAIGAKWKELSEEEKKKWNDMATEKGGKAGADEAAGDEEEAEEEEEEGDDEDEEEEDEEEEEEEEETDDDDDLFSPDDDGYGGKTKHSAKEDDKPDAADEAASGTAVAGDVEAEAEAEAEL